MSAGNSFGLKKTLGYFSLTNIVIANMIGAGIFTTSGLLLGQLNDPILLLALWVVGGGIALCGAFLPDDRIFERLGFVYCWVFGSHRGFFPGTQ